MIDLEILLRTSQRTVFFGCFATEYKSSIHASFSVSKFKMLYIIRDILALSFIVFFLFFLVIVNHFPTEIERVLKRRKNA